VYILFANIFLKKKKVCIYVPFYDIVICDAEQLDQKLLAAYNQIKY